MEWLTSPKFTVREAIFQGLVASLAGCLLGGTIYISILVPKIPPYWGFGLLGGVFLMILAARRPELVLLVLVFLTSSIVNETKVPFLDVGLKIFVYDGLFIVLILVFLLPVLLNPEKKFVRTPLDWPLFIFWVLALLSTYLVYWQKVQRPFLPNLFEFAMAPPKVISDAIPELRVFSYYLLFFVITNLIKTRKQARVVAGGLFLFGIMAATVLLLEENTNIHIPIAAAKSYTLTTESTVFSGVTRIIGFTGEAIILLCFMLQTGVLIFDTSKASRFWDIVKVVLFGLGVLATYHRNFWMAAGVAVFILVYFATERSRRRVYSWALAMSGVVMLVLVVVIVFPGNRFSQVAAGTIDRFTSFMRSDTYSAETGSQSTLRSRDVEYVYAYPQIIAHPIFGIGPGSTYRSRLPDAIEPLDYTGEEVGYLHNSHIWIMMKIGIPGYLMFLLLSIIFVVRGLTHWRKINDLYLRGILISSSAGYVGIFFGAMVNPILVTPFWIPLFAIMFGLNEVIIKLNNEECTSLPA